jgi:hypothetical protein
MMMAVATVACDGYIETHSRYEYIVPNHFKKENVPSSSWSMDSETRRSFCRDELKLSRSLYFEILK